MFFYSKCSSGFVDRLKKNGVELHIKQSVMKARVLIEINRWLDKQPVDQFNNRLWSHWKIHSMPTYSLFYLTFVIPIVTQTLIYGWKCHLFNLFKIISSDIFKVYLSVLKTAMTLVYVKQVEHVAMLILLGRY